jgi:proton-translocating NADH-quinone oxidoreductase chain N
MDYIILKSFIPEIFLSFCILFQLFFNSYIVNNIKFNFPIISKEIFFQVFFVFICLLFLFFNNKIEGFFYFFLFLNDFSTKIIKILLTIITLFILLPLKRSFISQNINFNEYFTLFLISFLSTLLITNASDMLSVYLVIELQTLCFYILASFRKNSSFSIEAGLKYFIFGSFISGIFLLGSAILFSSLGTLNFNSLNLLLSIPFSKNLIEEYNFILLGISLITIVFLFKIGSIPFHFWIPDVYEGSPLVSTIIFSVVPKFAIFYLFFKWVSIVGLFTQIKELLLFSGILSIFFGSFFAIRQKRLKRFIIYSSIAQTGFLTVSLVNTNYIGFLGLNFFLLIYIITSIIIWINVSLLFSFQNKINIFQGKKMTPLFLSTLSSFFFVNSLWSVSILFIFFSLSGVPPFVGFLSKILVIYSLIKSSNIFSSFLLIIISAISVFYYLRVIKIIFFEEKINLKLNSSQIIFLDYFFEKECLLIAFLLFLLIFLFFYPSLFIYIFYLIFNTYFF